MSSSSPAGRRTTFSPQQVAYCQEWRDLCYTLEKAQGDELCHSCHNKFQFAKTFAIFGRDFEQTVADVRQRVAQGHYSFFSDRGIPADVMTPTVAERMLGDWRHAIDAKRGHLEIVFRSKFGQTIDDCLEAEENAVQLNMAQPLEKTDAVALLSDYVRENPASESGPLQSEIEQVKSQLAYLNESVAAIDPTTLTGLAESVRQLRADVDRILTTLDKA